MKKLKQDIRFINKRYGTSLADPSPLISTELPTHGSLIKLDLDTGNRDHVREVLVLRGHYVVDAPDGNMYVLMPKEE